MRLTPHLHAPAGPLRFPWRTARLKLTALYGGLILVSGAALVAVSYVLFERATSFKSPILPSIPTTPSIPSTSPGAPFAAGSTVIQQFQSQLATGQHLLRQIPVQSGGDMAILTKYQHQLATSVHQLAQAVHQLSEAKVVQAAQRANDSHQLLVNSGIALAIVAVLAVVAGWFIAGRILRPIRTITRTAQRISSTNLHERLALAGPHDELTELGATLDDLFARLDAAFTAQRNFVANASHELRTPLTAERTLLQVALDDPDTSAVAWRATAHDVLTSSGEQERLIDGLLTLASSEGGTSVHDAVDLAPIAEKVLGALGPQIAETNLHVHRSLHSAPLTGDCLLVERLVVNLLTNAVVHNVPDGRLEVVTRVTDGAAVLTVSNTGAVISAPDVDRLFLPFQRLEQRRGHFKDGHGLGLSIVRAIATAHRATVRATPDVGGGLSVTVAFPVIAVGRSGDAPSSARQTRDHATPLGGRGRRRWWRRSRGAAGDAEPATVRAASPEVEPLRGRGGT